MIRRLQVLWDHQHQLQIVHEYSGQGNAEKDVSPLLQTEASVGAGGSGQI